MSLCVLSCKALLKIGVVLKVGVQGNVGKEGMTMRQGGKHTRDAVYHDAFQTQMGSKFVLRHRADRMN